MDTHHLDEARRIVGNQFCSHKLQIDNSGKSFHARHSAVEGYLLDLNYLFYGDVVTIEPGELENFYLIQIPILGSAKIQNGGYRFSSDSTAGSILNPDRHTRMTWYAGCQQLLIYIPRENLQKVAERHFGRHFKDIVFCPELDFKNPDLVWIKSAALTMAKAADRGDLFNSISMLSQSLFEEQFIIELIERQESNIHCFALSGSKSAAPKHAILARDYIIRHAAEAINMTDISKACDLPIRTLQHQFKNFYGVSPIEFLKKERLMRVYSEINSGSNDGVASLAAKWGFYHAGRFSECFKNEFGEAPSTTHKRSKELREYN